jgi:hypothetical protein
MMMLRSRVWIIAILAIAFLAFAAQAEENGEPAEEEKAQAEEQAAPAEEQKAQPEEQAAPAEEQKAQPEGQAAPAKIKFELPILLTSAGQSVDIKLAGVLLKRLEIEYVSKPGATPADLKDFKTLIIVPGYSSKGLGSAGISRDAEMKRVEAVLASAAEADIRVMTLHLGGKARRGVQSDDFNAKVVKVSDLAIIVAQGDEDGFFSDLCKEAGVPLEVVEAMADTMQPLKAVIAGE